MDKAINNKLLQLIPADELDRLTSFAERVELRPGQVLHQFRLPMEYVYFIESGLVSVAAKVARDRFVEAWLIGSEGLVGAPAVLAAGIIPLHRRTVQVGGKALRIRTAEFCEHIGDLPELRRAVDRYLSVVLSQTSQSGACNAYHNLSQRLARWLLVARSALRSNDLPLTHKVLAELLGVRRASVTECLEHFHLQGLVSTRRAHIRLELPSDLLSISCDCFRLIEREYERYLVATAVNSAAAIDPRRRARNRQQATPDS
jgi:CRP-like cAMP-binding protein